MKPGHFFLLCSETLDLIHNSCFSWHSSGWEGGAASCYIARGGVSTGSPLGPHWHPKEGGLFIYYTWAGVGVLAHYMVFIVTAAGWPHHFEATRGSAPSDSIPGRGWSCCYCRGECKASFPWCGLRIGFAGGKSCSLLGVSDITRVRVSRYLIPALWGCTSWLPTQPGLLSAGVRSPFFPVVFGCRRAVVV